MNKFITILSALALATSLTAGENKNNLGPANPEQIAKVKEALPAQAPAKPKKARNILIVSRCEGFVHGSIPLGVKTIQLMGEKTGAYTAEETKDLAVFNKQDLKKYDAVLFLSTTHLNPTPEQREALLDFVRGGKGIIGIHAAADNFYSWEAGAKMMGGLFCGHPWTAGCTVQVKLDEPGHPINECFHGKSFKVKDEIYQFKDPYSRKNQRVITSLDLDDPDTKAVKGGHPENIKRTDGDFGITWVHPEGKGRVFYCSMGHNFHIYWDNRILQHYLAGIQYALGDYEVADSLPTPFDAIHTLTVNQGQEIRYPIEQQVFGNEREALPAVEQQLLDVFQKPYTTLEGKRYACRMLRHCASEAAVPVLEKELLNPELSHYVRLVFQGLEGKAADAALISALTEADASLKTGIIGTLGQRGTTKAIKAIAASLNTDHTQLQLAAITALGNIGGKKALKALTEAEVKPELTDELKLAQLKAAKGVKPFILFRLFSSLSEKKVCLKLLDDDDENIRCAALAGLTEAAPKRALPLVLEHLTSEARIGRTARGVLGRLPADKLAAAIAGRSPATQVILIQALAARRAIEAEDAVRSLIDSDNEQVSQAAKRAMATIATTRSVPALIESGNFDALSALKAEGTDTALLQALEAESDERKAAELIMCLAERQASAALPAFVELAKADWNRKTAAAIEGMAQLVSEPDFTIYTELIFTTDNVKKIKAIEKSMRTAIQYQSNPLACATILASVYPDASGEAKYALIRALGSMGGSDANRILSEARVSKDPKAQDAAVRGLCSSPNPAVADELLKLARNTDNEIYKVLALRGYIRLANTLNDADKVVPMCRNAAALTDRPAELKSIIACVKRTKSKGAVELVASLIEKPGMLTDCGWAIIEISWNWQVREDCVEPLKKILSLSNDKDLKFYASDRIKAITQKN